MDNTLTDGSTELPTQEGTQNETTAATADTCGGHGHQGCCGNHRHQGSTGRSHQPGQGCCGK